ncbi:alginate lyase family protein [Aeromonas veronii]
MKTITLERDLYYKCELDFEVEEFVHSQGIVVNKIDKNTIIIFQGQDAYSHAELIVRGKEKKVTYRVEITDKSLTKYDVMSYTSLEYLTQARSQFTEENCWHKTFSINGKHPISISHLRKEINQRKKHSYSSLNNFKTYIDIDTRKYYFQKYKPFDANHPINWGENKAPYNTRSWQYSLNAWFFMDSLLTIESESTHKIAIDIAWDWIEFNIINKKRNDYAWYDMAVAIRTPKLCYIFSYAIANDLLNDMQIQWFAIAIRAHILDLSDELKLALHSNHGLYQLSGILGAIRYLPEIKDSFILKNFASQLFTNVALKDINHEGMHLEHSPAYHMFMFEAIGNLLHSGWIDDERLTEKLPKMERIAKFLFHPNGVCTRFGDSSQRLARHVIPEFSNYLSPIKCNESEAGEYSDKELIIPDSGYYFYRSDWRSINSTASYLAFSAAFHKRTHKHADDFTFEWSELGKRILVDAGMFGYEREAIEREYVQSTRAHNCVEIDETDYSRYNLDIFGSAITAWAVNSDVKIIESFIFRKRFFGTKHRRVMVYKPGHWLLVLDHLSSNEKHKFTQWFHFDPELELFQSIEETYTSINDSTKIYVDNFNNEEVLHVKAQFEPRLQGWTSIEPYQLTPNDALGFTANNKNEHTFATLFSVTDTLQKPQKLAFNSSSNGKYIRVKWQNPNGNIEDFIYRISHNERTATINGEELSMSNKD